MENRPRDLRRLTGLVTSMRRFLLTLAACAAALTALAPAAAAAGRCGDRPWCDTALGPDQRAGLLLGALTRDEKIDLLAGDELLGVVGQEGTHTGTSNGVERVGLPPTLYSDGPVGARSGSATALPAAMALAATFDRRLANLAGKTVGNEVKFKGNDVVFAPTLNIVRTPLWGRTFETYGEDPFLSGELGVEWVRGAQSEGVIATVKHYAVNNQEGSTTGGNRLSVEAIVNERTLREIYLAQFERAITRGNPGAVMCSYPRVNGRYACENEHLLEDILRGDWGFDGYVLADYGAAKNTLDSLRNGLDFDPWPALAYSRPAIETASLPEPERDRLIDEHVRRILRTLFAYGFFDREAHPADDELIDKDAHFDVTRQIEEAGITLLRNDGLLPLDMSRTKTIAVIGADATTYKNGGGSSNVKPFRVSLPLDAIRARAGEGVEVRYDPGEDADAAVAAATGADVVLLFASDTQTEFMDKSCLTLNCGNRDRGDQDGLIEAVSAANPNTAVVLLTGGPVLTPWRTKLRALVEAWYPGADGGNAIARVLFGDADPGGRLPATFPDREEDTPTSGDPEKYPGVAERVVYKEGVFVGYRWYDERALGVAYPFGHGLSYTTFNYSDLRVGPREVSALVTNSGRRAGTDVAQLYLGMPEADGRPQPPFQLKGFAKVALQPGESARVNFPLDVRAFSYWDTPGDDWQVAPGCYEVWVGRSSRDLPLHGGISQGGASCERVRGVRGATACGNAAGLRAVRAVPDGTGARLGFTRTGPGKVDIDIFRVARGRSVTRPTLVAHYVNRTTGLRWRPRRLADGWYVIRYRLRGSTPDARRAVLQRRNGRFAVRPVFGLRPGCAAIGLFELGSPVFGGRGETGLRARVRMARRALVTVDLMRGRRVVRRVARRSVSAGRALAVTIPARRLRAGRYTVRVTAGAGRRPERAALAAQRL